MEDFFGGYLLISVAILWISMTIAILWILMATTDHSGGALVSRALLWPIWLLIVLIREVQKF